MISRQTIRDFFATTAANGADLNREMLWGYFFVDPRRRALAAIVAKLEARGFRYVDILGSSSDDDTGFHLHVERVERHTATSLHRLCGELAEIAERAGIAAYDGFDVGNVDGSILYP